MIWWQQLPLFVPRFRESAGTLNLIRLSVRHKNFNLGHNFCTITGRALILGMCVLCDKTFPMVPCRDLDGDLWPSLMSNLLPSGGPQFSEFACLKHFYMQFHHFILPFQLYRSCIPSHSVYAPAVERVIHKLWHPSEAEVNQEIIHAQEVSIKHSMGLSNGQNR